MCSIMKISFDCKVHGRNHLQTRGYGPQKDGMPTDHACRYLRFNHAGLVNRDIALVRAHFDFNHAVLGHRSGVLATGTISRA